jgi:hypothetical protein
VTDPLLALLFALCLAQLGITAYWRSEADRAEAEAEAWRDLALRTNRKLSDIRRNGRSDAAQTPTDYGND